MCIRDRYNIIKQYDKRRNSRKPKPRSLVDFDISTMKKLMIHRRETNENLSLIHISGAYFVCGKAGNMNINRKISKYNFNKGSVSRIKYIVIHYVGALGGAEDVYKRQG